MVEILNNTGLYATMSLTPLIDCPTDSSKPTYLTRPMCKSNWYRSTDVVRGINNLGGGVVNKKWPLKKVL